ncbi:MAG: hypothetical protein CSA11_00655 [Chloroflexi bacterium]|nr:MAG: hypothetical protein CSB13_07285 [Chloroflexota bacterium]PIE82434.1 MAG: hypothetical protein CSA11_00655 [Chloroflexota bacterium]
MKKLKGLSTFFFGLLFGTLVGLLVWYWYKSTSAENGALELLDRMAATDVRLRDLKHKLASESVESYITLEPQDEQLPPFLDKNRTKSAHVAGAPEDLQRVKGIGPIFAAKLLDVGIRSTAALTAVSPADLAKQLNISAGRAANILAEARKL